MRRLYQHTIGKLPTPTNEDVGYFYGLFALFLIFIDVVFNFRQHCIDLVTHFYNWINS